MGRDGLGGGLPEEAEAGRRKGLRDGGSAFRCLISSKGGSDRNVPRVRHGNVYKEGGNVPRRDPALPRRPPRRAERPADEAHRAQGTPSSLGAAHERAGIDRCRTGARGARGLVRPRHAPSEVVRGGTPLTSDNCEARSFSGAAIAGGKGDAGVVGVCERGALQ